MNQSLSSTQQSEPLKALTVYVSADEAQAAELLAARDDRSVSYFIRQLLRERLALDTADPQYSEAPKARS